MQKTAPKSIKTNNVKIQEYHNLTKIGPSVGSISKHVGHLSVLEKTGDVRRNLENKKENHRVENVPHIQKLNQH